MDSSPVLSGLRIVEFSAFVAAPSCGLTLTQMGAEVIRVDPRGGNIDFGRWPLNAQGKSLYWASLNRGKHSVELDVRNPRGRQLMADLITAPGEGGGIFLTNLGVDGELGYEALAAKRPDLIMVQLIGSSDGANALDYTVNSAVGYPMVTGDGRTPVNHVLPAWDLLAGMTLATAILAAVHRRTVSGQGQFIRLALSDVAMAATSILGYIAEVQVNDSDRQADGNFLYGAYGDAFATADQRRVMVVAISDRQYIALVKAAGMQAAIQSAADTLGYRLDSESGRYEARELISAFLRPWFGKHTLAQVADKLSDKAILWGPYRTFRQMVEEDPRCSEKNPMFRTVNHPGYGSFLTSRSPLSFGVSENLPPAAGPQLGQHGDDVLGRVLGLDDATRAALRAEGVLGAGQR